jgi:hypothetical protein
MTTKTKEKSKWTNLRRNTKNLFTLEHKKN